MFKTTEDLEKLKRNSQLSNNLGSNKQRSSIGSNISGKETQRTSRTLSETVKEEIAIPENIPSFDDAWKTFIKGTQYEKINETAKEYETKLKKCNVEYVQKVKALQTLINYSSDVRNKLTRVQIRRDLSNLQNDGMLKILEDQEHLLGKELSEIEKSVSEQKQTVLMHQTELVLNLQMYHDVKATMDKNFQEFCNENFKTLIPKLDYSTVKYRLDFNTCTVHIFLKFTGR